MNKENIQRIPDKPPHISPVPSCALRPLWSVMIPVYNCAPYLRQTITSVLLQDPGIDVMQIEVVDDCSSDEDVEQLVQVLGKGRVKYFRQKENVGSLRNFETCINRAQGHYVHLLHGDDRVKPGYYQKINELFEKYPDAGAAFCAWDYINDNGNYLYSPKAESSKPGILEGWLYKLVSRGRLQYVCITVKRSVYEELGSFYGVNYGEDWEMWARIARYYPMAYTPESLAEYREHSNSISSQSFLSGQNIKDIAKVVTIINGYVEEKDRKGMMKISRQNYVYWALGATFKLWKSTKNVQAVKIQAKEIMRVYCDFWVIRKVIRLQFYMWIENVLNKFGNKAV